MVDSIGREAFKLSRYHLVIYLNQDLVQAYNQIGEASKDFFRQLDRIQGSFRNDNDELYAVSPSIEIKEGWVDSGNQTDVLQPFEHAVVRFTDNAFKNLWRRMKFWSGEDAAKAGAIKRLGERTHSYALFCQAPSDKETRMLGPRDLERISDYSVLKGISEDVERREPIDVDGQNYLTIDGTNIDDLHFIWHVELESGKQYQTVPLSFLWFGTIATQVAVSTPPSDRRMANRDRGARMDIRDRGVRRFDRNLPETI